MTDLPLTPDQPRGSKALGCLVYLIAAPIVALFLAIELMVPVQFVLEEYGFCKETISYVILPLFAVVAIGTLVLSFREFRDRAAKLTMAAWVRKSRPRTRIPR